MAIRWDKFTVKAQEAVQRANELASEHGNAEVLPPQSEAHKSMAHDPLYEGVKWGGGG